MKRMKLKELLNLTEFAPTAPPMGDIGGGPVPAPQQPGGLNAGNVGGEQPEPEAPPAPNSPTPENPSEYDFTKDFREFEDKKNKAEAEAKKALMEKLNERLLGKTITANASRGYGQPKTDYTIEGVKKVSVEFWYKDWVVIAMDKNDKKYFLTTGVNIHIDQGQEAGAEETPEGQPQQKQGGQQTPPPEEGSGQEEAPNPEGQPEQQPQSPTNGAAQPASPQQQPPLPKGGVPPADDQPQPEEEEPEQDPRLKKKKKVGLPQVNEYVIHDDLNTFLNEFMSDHIKNDRGNVNYFGYIKELSKILTENKNSFKVKCQLSIPQTHMVNNVDIREIKLAAVDTMRKSSGGHYERGCVDIQKNGRYYLLEYTKEVGYNRI